MVLAVLGVAYSHLAPTASGRGWGIVLVAIGLPLMFMLGMPGSLVDDTMRIVARGGAALAGVGLLALTAPLLWRLPVGRERWLWGLPLGLLALKLVAQILASLPPDLWWEISHLRVFYMHLLLLGVVSLGLVGCAAGLWGTATVRGWRWFFGAAVLILASLLPVAGYGAGLLSTIISPLVFATWVAPVPVLAAGWMLYAGLLTRNRHRTA